MDSGVDPDAATELLDPLVLRARARVGHTLRGKWHLDALLGVGGMAAVYAATHRNSSRGAVKLLHAELSMNSAIRQRFIREGHAANTVGHDGAVRVLDDDVAEDGSLYLVAELLDGETLEERRLRAGGRLTEDEVLSMADQVLDVLVAAHGKGIVHRDLKPENIFLTRTGVVKVLDFGIARLRELSTASTATRTGSTMGTPAFMAPEQARGLWDEVDGRTDLWAVGATMFALLSGRLVHDGRTANEVLVSAVTKRAPALASVLPDVAPSVARVVDRALAYEKDARWPDAAQMQEAVRRAYHDRHGSPISTAPRLTVPETVPNRTLPSASSAIAPRLPTTGQPVESARSAGDTAARHAPRGLRVGIMVAGVLGVGMAISGVTWVVASTHHASATSAGSTSALRLATTPTSATTAPIAPSTGPAPQSAAPPLVATTPSIEATDLPTATAAPRPTAASRPKPVASSTPTAPAPASPAKPACDPPYTIDRAGHRIPKPECM